MLTAVEFFFAHCRNQSTSVGANHHLLAHARCSVRLQADRCLPETSRFCSREQFLTVVGRSVDMAFSFFDLARALSFQACLFMNAREYGLSPLVRPAGTRNP
jgi:hypothetical protein